MVNNDRGGCAALGFEEEVNLGQHLYETLCRHNSRRESILVSEIRIPIHYTTNTFIL